MSRFYSHNAVILWNDIDIDFDLCGVKFKELKHFLLINLIINMSCRYSMGNKPMKYNIITIKLANVIISVLSPFFYYIGYIYLWNWSKNWLKSLHRKVMTLVLREVIRRQGNCQSMFYSLEPCPSLRRFCAQLAACKQLYFFVLTVIIHVLLHLVPIRLALYLPL